MKISVSQLRRIVREEVERSLDSTPAAVAATIADAAGVGTPDHFARAAAAVSAMIAGTYPLDGATPRMALENILDMALYDAGGLEPHGGVVGLASAVAAHYGL